MRGLLACAVGALVWLTGCQSSLPPVAPGAKPAIFSSIEPSLPRPNITTPQMRERSGRPAAAADKPGLFVRVVDVGQALCIVGVTPDGFTFLIDAGHWGNNQCLKAVEELLPGGIGVSLIVLTHSDSDHLGNLRPILERGVDTILWTGRIPVDCRGSRGECPKTFVAAAEAIGLAAQQGATVINLMSTPMTPGQSFTLGAVEVTFLAGWNEFPGAAGLSPAEQENVVSIMTRITYGPHSLLVTGDAIGRELDGADDECHGSEAWALQNLVPELLKADVLVASHHGGDNGSANCFIKAVDPEFVVFSAGGGYNHPRQSTAERFLNHGIPANRLLRTDRGSNSEDREWVDGLTPQCGDGVGDDSVDMLFSDQRLRIGYQRSNICPG